MINELCRLTMCNKYGIKSTDMTEFITKERVLYRNKFTYANFVWNYRPLKSEPHRIKLVAGGDTFCYDNDAGAPSASLIKTKALINSIISDTKQGAKFMSCVLKDFFIATPMSNLEFMKIRYKYITDNIREKYDLGSKLVQDGYIYIYVKIKKACMDWSMQ